MSPRSPVWGFSPAVVFCLHLAATLAMTGIIWFIQIVHYPLYDHVPAAAFAGYEAAHTRLIVWIVIPLMAVETMTGLLLWWRRPAAVPRALIVIGLGLLGIIWFSTAVFQIPQHLRLAHGFDPSAHHLLVVSNWIRTVAWSARSVVALRMVWGMVSS